MEARDWKTAGLAGVALQLKAFWEAWREKLEEERKELEQAERVAEKFLGKCERPGCRGNTGRVNQAYCPECKKRMEEAQRMAEQRANK